MKKYILNAIAIFTFATGLSSCGDSFLETMKSALIVGQFIFVYIVCKSCGTDSHRFVTHSSGFSLGQVLRKNLSLLRDIRLTVYLI